MSTLDELNNGKTVESNGDKDPPRQYGEGPLSGEVMEREQQTLEDVFADMDRHAPALGAFLRDVHRFMNKYADRTGA